MLPLLMPKASQFHSSGASGTRRALESSCPYPRNAARHQTHRPVLRLGTATTVRRNAGFTSVQLDTAGVCYFLRFAGAALAVFFFAIVFEGFEAGRRSIVLMS